MLFGAVLLPGGTHLCRLMFGGGFYRRTLVFAVKNPIESIAKMLWIVVTFIRYRAI